MTIGYDLEVTIASKKNKNSIKRRQRTSRRDDNFKKKRDLYSVMWNNYAITHLNNMLCAAQEQTR